MSWTKEQLIDIVAEEGHSPEEAQALFEFLWGQRRLVPLNVDSDEPRFRTDTAELIRLSTFNYNRYVKTGMPLAPTQAGVTWSIEPKMTPEWSMGIPEVIEILCSEVENGWVDESGNTQNYTSTPRRRHQYRSCFLHSDQ